ncbi:MAG: hypothetical protein KAX19_09990, partial [Candidatus Brocadiae bacterium]|nr:hypothetical protein [Candidatus Brocadiia bacterium]
MAARKSALTAYLKRALLFGGTALCLFALIAAIWARGATETHRVIYRLRPPGKAVADGELRDTVDVLSERLAVLRREFKTGRGAILPLPPDRLEVQLRCRSDPVQPLAWLAMQGRAEFRLLHPQDDLPGSVAAEDLPPGYEVKVFRERRYILTRLNELKTVEHRYAVERKPVLTIGEFKEVSFATVGRQRTVVLTSHFKEPDAGAFASLTALHAGRNMAMLIDGAMFFPPKEIESALTTGAVQVQ